MAGEKKQSTTIKETNAIVRSSTWGQPKHEDSMKDANMLKVGVTNCEDSSTKIVRQGTQMAEDAFAVFDAAYKKMVIREHDVEARVKTHTAILKDKANQIAEAIGRINKLAGPDIEEKLQRLERFSAAVETLDRLNKSGKLASVAEAIKGLSH